MPNWKKVLTSGSAGELASLYAPSITGSLLGTSSYAVTASYVTILNQNVIITGSLSVGTGSGGPSENTLTLGARDNGSEGGQLGFNAPGGTYTSASMIDLYQNRLRILRGTNAGSDAEVAWWSMHTKQLALPAYNSTSAFPGTAAGYLAFDSSGNIITVAGSGGGGSTTPGGSNTQIQYNNSNTFGGVPTLTYDGTTLRATGSFTGSLVGELTGTASYATQALSSSYAVTASYANYAETASRSSITEATQILVLNQSGYTITKGLVVHITASGNSSDIPRVISASYENDSLSANTLGLATQNITNGSQGYVITEGVLTGIDTSLFQSGQLIFLGSQGTITGSAPHAPLHSVRLGQVIREQSNNGSIHVRVDNGYELGELHDITDNTTSASYGDLLVKSGSIWTSGRQLTGSYGLTGSLSFNNGGVTGSLFGTASYATTASRAITSSFAITASNATGLSTLNQNVIITGSLTVTNDLIVLGSASVQYITSSQLNIDDNIITVNTLTPSIRYGGISVIDSGSSPLQSGSLLFDSQNNQWIFVHQNAPGSSVTSSVLLMGPQTFNNLGNETGLTANRIPKASGADLGEHLTDSNIEDTGTLVSITVADALNSSAIYTQPNNITSTTTNISTGFYSEIKYTHDQIGIRLYDASDMNLGSVEVTNGLVRITGSLDVKSGITGSLFGTASWAQNFNTSSLLTTASFVSPNIVFTKGDSSTFGVDISSIAAFPITVNQILTASILSGTSLTLPNSLTFLSSSQFELLNVFVNGIKLRYDIDFIPTTTQSIQMNISIPSGSEMQYISIKRP